VPKMRSCYDGFLTLTLLQQRDVGLYMAHQSSSSDEYGGNGRTTTLGAPPSIEQQSWMRRKATTEAFQRLSCLSKITKLFGDGMRQVDDAASLR
jgi:hypothetical protein